MIADPRAGRPFATITDRADIAERLAVLTPNQREAVWNVYGEGETTGAVAVRLGVSASRVSQLAHVGLKKMRAAGN